MRFAVKLPVIVLLIACPAVVCGFQTHVPRFSPDGAIVAVPEENCTVVLWDVATGNKIATLYEPIPQREYRSEGERQAALQGSISCKPLISFSPDGKLLATQRPGQSAILWDARDGRDLAKLSGQLHPGDYPRAVNLESSSDSRLILEVAKANAAAAKFTRVNKITVWDVATHKELLHVREDQKKEFHEAVLSPDGKTVMALVGSKPINDQSANSPYPTDTIKLWDIQQGKKLVTLTGDSAKFSPDGKFLLFADSRVIWDIHAGKMLSHPAINGTRQVQFSPDEKLLVQLGADCAVVWDLAPGNKVATFCCPQQSPVPGAGPPSYSMRDVVVSFSPDGKMLATQCRNGPITLWNMQDGRKFATSPSGGLDVSSLQFSTDSRLLLSVGGRGKGAGAAERWWPIITVSDIATQRKLLQVKLGQNAGFERASFSRDGKMIIAYVGEHLKGWEAGKFSASAIKLWDVDRAEELATLKASSVTSASFSPDGKSLLIADPALGTRVWDIRARKMRTIGQAAPPHQARDLTADNAAKSIGDNKWNWTVFVKGDKQDIDKIKCVEYTLHPTFRNPVRLICESGGDPQRPFGLSATGWGTFSIGIRVFMKDGTHQDLKHQLKF
jgi:WD40 repeat protein